MIMHNNNIYIYIAADDNTHTSTLSATRCCDCVEPVSSRAEEHLAAPKSWLRTQRKEQASAATTMAMAHTTSPASQAARPHQMPFHSTFSTLASC